MGFERQIRRPKKINYKITPELEKEVISIREKNWLGSRKICNFVPISHWTVNKILKKNKLTISPERRKKRIKYIRWQREHPNSLWQIDHSDQKIENKYVISVIDDCSRKNLAFLPVNQVTTDVVIELIDKLIKIYGNLDKY